MKTNKRLVGTRKSVHANISAANHVRLKRHAEASSVSGSKYVGLAAEFLLDLEQAFGGPLTEQFRRSMVQLASRYEAAQKKVFS